VIEMTEILAFLALLGCHMAFTDQGKPALDEIEPRSRSRGEMHVKARMAHEPSFDRGRLVRAVVVQDEVHLELGRHVGLDRAQEREGLFANGF
jgi:hypothetical protein